MNQTKQQTTNQETNKMNYEECSRIVQHVDTADSIELDRICDNVFPELQTSGNTYEEYRDKNYDKNDYEYDVLTAMSERWWELESE